MRLFSSWKKRSTRKSSTHTQRSPWRIFKLRLELLEDRTLPSTFWVTNTNDSGPGSLRQALLDANANAGQDTIDFNIGSGGVQTIQPLSELTITDPVVIDGWTQPGFSGTPIVELDFSHAVLTSDFGRLVITAGNSTVRGLVVNRIGPAYGILLNGGGNNVIEGCYVGTDVTGTVAMPGDMSGGYGDSIVISGPSSDNRIGSDGVNDDAAERNLISGSSGPGIVILEGADLNLIAGNYVGTDVTGTKALGNGQLLSVANNAVQIASRFNRVERNVISGNIGPGLALGGSNNVLSGNYIGTDVTGTLALGNVDSWAVRVGGSGNLVGSNADGVADAAERNVISGNTGAGVYLGDKSNTLAGNYIGLDATGAHALGNAGGGVLLVGESNSVGGTNPAARNIISGNTGDGIDITGSGTTGNLVEGNYIGTDAAGSGHLANDRGVLIDGGASNNTVGGASSVDGVTGKLTGAGNVISGNLHSAVNITASVANVVQGNFIGTDVTGTLAVPNGAAGDGIYVDGVDLLSGASGNQIGGPSFLDANGNLSGLGNLISGNHDFNSHGVFMYQYSAPAPMTGAPAPVTNNLVQGNFIGTDITGKHRLENWGNGIDVFPGATNNTIGGTVSGTGNLLSGNLINGIFFDLGANSNTVVGNYIGTDVTGTVALGNGNDGVDILKSAGNTIGGTTAGARNIISGNNANGVEIDSSSSSENVIEGNYIGTDAAGVAPLPNAGSGVRLKQGASSNMVGGTTPGAGNVVSGNGYRGVYLTDSGTDQNVIEGNYVGTNAAGTAAIGNGDSGVSINNGSANIVGGTVTGTGNLISGNADGVGIGAGASNTLVQGNYIGTDYTGTRAIGNTFDGVISDTGANNYTLRCNVISGNGYLGIAMFGVNNNLVVGNFIGTNAAGTAPIANNGRAGLVIDGGTSNSAIVQNLISGNKGPGIIVDGSSTLYIAIHQNLIYNNGGSPQAIQLLNGGNANQPAPVLTTAKSDGTITEITGTLTAAPSTSYSLDFFSGASAGQASSFLGTATVTTNGSGVATVDATFQVGTPIGAFAAATATDPNGNTSELSRGTPVATLNTPPTANAGGPYTITYGSSVTLDASASADPDGDPLTFSWTVNGQANAASGVHPTLTWSQLTALGVAGSGSFPVSVAVNDGYYAPVNSALTNLTVTPAPTGTTLSASLATPLSGVDIVTFTATVTETVPGVTLGGTVDFVDVTAGTDLGIVPLLNGAAALNASFFTLGSHTITATYSGTANFGSSHGSTSVTVIPRSSLSGVVFVDFNDDGQVDFGEKGIAGVAIALAGTDDLGHAVNLQQLTDADGFYAFLNLRPGSYTLTETQPAGYGEGINTLGTAGGTQALDQFFVALGAGVDGMNYNYGERPPATGAVQKGQTANIAFWNNKNGQALIRALNGGTGHELADWLAATLPNIFGVHAGADNLTGKSNADVAAFFQQEFLQKGIKLDAQVLATALSVYATNATLDSTGLAAQYGFTVSGYGLGTATVNVRNSGAAFGVADNTVMTVMDLLLATNSQAVNGVLYSGNTAKRTAANSVYSAVNG